jgi:hypothetical protein
MADKKVDYGFVYKCRLCGELKTNPRFYAERNEALTRLLNIMLHGSYTNGFTVTDTDVHTCANGDIGISDLQGIRVITP